MCCQTGCCDVKLPNSKAEEEGCTETCCTSPPLKQPHDTAPSEPNDDSCSCCASDTRDNVDPVPVRNSTVEPEEQDGCSCCSAHNSGAEVVETVPVASINASPAIPTLAVNPRDIPPSCECCTENRRNVGKRRRGFPIFSARQIQLQFVDESCCQSACCKTYARRRPGRRFNRTNFFWPRGQPAITCCTGSDIAMFQRLPEPQVEELEKELTLAITGMDCPACTVRVERALKNLGTTSIKVDFVGAFASCKYVSGELSAELIRKKVEIASGFRCSISKKRNGQRTLLIRFTAGAPDINKLQLLFGPTQEIQRVSRTDLRFTITTKSCRDIYDILTHQNISIQPIHDNEQEDTRQTILRDLKLSFFRFLASTAFTVPVLVLAWSPGYDQKEAVRGGVSLGLSTLVVVGCARQIILSATRCLVVDHELDADVLISLSTLSAYIYSIASYGYNVATKTNTLESYFETVTLLVTLILFGRLVAVYTRKAAIQSFSLLSGQNQSEEARLSDGSFIHTSLLDAGDIIVVGTNEVVASDGIVVSGQADIDESLITGEALPVAKGRGTFVLAGTRVVAGEIHLRLTKCVQDNSLAELHRLTDEARSSRAPVQDAADKVARYLIPLVLFVSAVCLLTWTLVLKFRNGRSSGSSVAGGLSYAVAVLALSCPCALTLCVPLVVLYAKNACQARGLLFKSSAALQISHKTTHVIFDKTGTLTTGRLRVAEAHYEDNSSKGLISSLVNGSEHPVSAAVALHLSSSPSKTVMLCNIETISGKGIQAVYNSEIIRGGNASWCEMKTHPVVVRMLGEGRSIFVVTRSQRLCAAFSLEDDLRPETIGVIQSLLRAGKQVSILSGDHQAAVDSLIARMGFDSSTAIDARGDCSPDDKKLAVRVASWGASCEQDDVENEGVSSKKTRFKDIVAFVGDGSNDTAALSQADVGISMSAGTSLALNSADIVILSGGLNGVTEALNMSKKSWGRIVLGLGWSLLYNTLAIIFGSGMLVQVRVEPQWAGLGELASLLPLVIIAQSLRFWF